MPGPIVIGFDGSPLAQEAVRRAADLLEGRGTVLILTVWEPGLGFAAAELPTGLDVPSTPLDVDTAMEIDEANEDRAHRVAQQGVQLAHSLGFAQAEAEVVPDEANVADTLVEVADRHHARAIVIGSRGLGGLKARLLGSTSNKVVQHAHCPVVVVHAPQQSG